MTRSLTSAATACTAALILAGAAAAPANAYYLGYGNGYPGAWDLWTEQNGGRNPEMPGAHIKTTQHHAPSSHAHNAHHAHNMHKPSGSEGKVY